VVRTRVALLVWARIVIGAVPLRPVPLPPLLVATAITSLPLLNVHAPRTLLVPIVWQKHRVFALGVLTITLADTRRELVITRTMRLVRIMTEPLLLESLRLPL